jgi:hypothetical protein
MPKSGANSFFKNNGLTLAMLGLFVACIVGQSIAGHLHHNAEQRDEGRPELSYVEYLSSPDFVEAVFENWESEFLQMAVFVVLAAFLVQKGSAESKAPEEQDEDREREHEEERNPPSRNEVSARDDAPWPVHRGGLALALYSRSLSIALFSLFIISLALHAFGGVKRFNENESAHGRATLSPFEYLGTSSFWFESLQNWQSEFLSVAALILLSIVLRQRGSSQSKPVDASNAKTGS